MGARGELFTTEVILNNRSYFFNVKENRTGDVFLQVVESKNIEGEKFDRRAIVVFEEDMQKFFRGLDASVTFIEKNRRQRLKEAAEKKSDVPAKSKRVYRKTTEEKNPGQEKVTPERKSTGKLRVVPRKK
ncbi:MAG: DUF3276 family protein [Spirochaetaceae bacterium]|jgi:REP element-mobilizing transposase RayT|nr:DUF3276 family protein [Spirochaetaceae bacterium]